MLERFPSRAVPGEELRGCQLNGLKWTVSHAHAGSAFYRKKFDVAGIGPQDIRTLDDLGRLPLTTAEELQTDYPFPLRAAAHTDIVRIHSSSGSTGKRKILSYTQKDIDDWACMLGRCYELAGVTKEDRVQICVGYGLWTAGVGFQLGCEKLGALAVPTGPGNLDLQCTFLVDLQSTVVCATASMAVLLAEEVHRRGLRDRIGVRKVICGAERTSPAMVKRIKERMGIDEVYDIPGLTELYGPGTGLSCRYEDGIHYWTDFYLLEILDPASLKPVPPGEVGEMVFTTLTKEGAPLIRYRSRDLSRFIDGPCPCGCVFPRHDRILGRSDDMFIFRGVNIYPRQLELILAGVPELGSEYQVVLERGQDGRDSMTMRVECAEHIPGRFPERLDEEVANRIKHDLMVSCTVELLADGTLPRTDRKTRRVLDHRAV